MYRMKIMLLMLILCLLLCRCTRASQVEDQAYVLVMGLDRGTDGSLEMTVQIPKVSGSTSESNSEGSEKNYMQLRVKANDFEGALEKLDWASPRNVNLAQMKLIVISQTLAQENQFPQIIANIAQTERLFTATKVAVCEGSAGEFVAAVRPYIGTRLSTDIEAMFEHYNDRGYVPESSLADLYYQTESVYSDPIVSYVMLSAEASQEKKDTESQAAFSQNIQDASDSYESEIPTRYLGAAAFSNGILRGVFSGEQTIFINLMRNELDSFRYEIGGQSLEFVPTRSVRMRIDTVSRPLRLIVDMELSYAAQERIPNEGDLKKALQDELTNVIKCAQQMNVEPFGFSERAAGKFLTISDWTNFDWKTLYSDAKIEIKLDFAQSDA